MSSDQFVLDSASSGAFTRGGQGVRLSAPSKVSVLVASVALGAMIVYATGGTGYAYPYIMLLPIILTAAWFGVIPTIVSAIVAGLLLGPFMPLDVETGRMQSSENWLARICFFVVISVFTSGLFQNLRTITRRHLQNLQTDRNTGLPNQAALKDELANLLSGRRSDTTRGESPAVLLVRLHDLWEVMEAMGTQASDSVVKRLADKISKSVPGDSQVYRSSTSEILLLFFASSHSEVDSVSKLVRAIGEEEINVDDVSLRVQLVAGSYFVDKGVAEPDVVVNRARTALFAALDSSRFYCAYDSTFDVQTSERVQLISSVRSGLKKDQFTLFYQPKICMKSGRQCGGEGLLRWFRSDGAMVMPGIFMPKLEKTTLIDPVTRFVIRKACEDIKRYDLSNISINFSSKNLMDSALVKNLGRIVAVYGVEPECLEIEITEGALIQDPAHAKVAIQSLRHQGFRVSLDDFGTGYSSFQYLTHLPITGLKIDRAFVINLEESEHARTVMRSMISMAHALGLHVTVEGIETEEQHEIVSGFGADTAQGYYYSKPIPATDYEVWRHEFDAFSA